jgi:hypothetical protein
LPLFEVHGRYEHFFPSLSHQTIAEKLKLISEFGDLVSWIKLMNALLLMTLIPQCSRIQKFIKKIDKWMDEVE